LLKGSSHIHVLLRIRQYRLCLWRPITPCHCWRRKLLCCFLTDKGQLIPHQQYYNNLLRLAPSKAISDLSIPTTRRYLLFNAWSTLFLCLFLLTYKLLWGIVQVVVDPRAPQCFALQNTQLLGATSLPRYFWKSTDIPILVDENIWPKPTPLVTSAYLTSFMVSINPFGPTNTSHIATWFKRISIVRPPNTGIRDDLNWWEQISHNCKTFWISLFLRVTLVAVTSSHQGSSPPLHQTDDLPCNRRMLSSHRLALST